MHYLLRKHFWVLCLLLSGIYSCKNAEKKDPADEKSAVVGTPVTVTSVGSDPLEEYVELNATSSFLQKNYVKANVNGYISEVNTQPGKFVNTGQTLFVVKTKEAQSINDAVSKIDPSLKFSGSNNIKATGSGFITQLNHQPGDYVQDGEQLAVISNSNSFVFLLNLPYELRQYVKVGSIVDLALADGTKLKGTITTAMPGVDPGSQTQAMVIKVANTTGIPENLIAKVTIVKARKSNVISLPRQAILSNDMQTEFWVMKVIDSTTAAKVAVKKGLETKDRVEISEPVFETGDKILLTGNFGLPDTARIKIIQ